MTREDIRLRSEACARQIAERMALGASSIGYLVQLMSTDIEVALTEVASKAAADELWSIMDLAIKARDAWPPISHEWIAHDDFVTQLKKRSGR